MICQEKKCFRRPAKFISWSKWRTMMKALDNSQILALHALSYHKF